ncbi:polysaccharide pyruvyl transferase [Leptolyngbya sp. Heron Island J]|uniref:polysaccharide pyruvyl transferase family protein n=1 Tax=Leptolyngbya sp. Heron Island J TaxID=1385935 RepID=UPI0003B986E5|nr:polysaccharide pyruvyl transferase family protein [Leptolyngbya sp. Heron Island J]ESA37062.1 polysaccharide pyruvyl transferase [Leptolyngbya sp. Heron Island J]
MVFSKRHRLLICGFYGHHNLGDEAMLAGMLRLLQRCLGPNYLDQITVYSNDPEDTAMRHGVATLGNQFPRRRREKWIQWMDHTLALWQHQFFILGGGDLLRDSSTRDVATTWLQPLQRAMTLGCRTIVLGISVGEIWKPQTKMAIVETLNRVNLIAVRDQGSQEKLQQMGVTRPIYVISDLALQLTTTPMNFGSQAVSAPQRSAPKIAISIRSLTGRLPEIDQAVEHRFYREMAQIIDYLVETKGATVSLFPFQTEKPNDRGQDNDEDAINAVLQRSRQKQHVTAHGAFNSVEQALDVLQSFDLVIGTRLHSLILAAGLGIPLLAAVYDPKVSGFITEIEQQVNSFSIQQFTLDTVKPRLEALLSQSSQSQHRLIQAVERYRQQMTPIERKLCQLLDS